MKAIKCTHEVQSNEYGIFAMHCSDNEPLGKQDLAKVLAGPIAKAERQLKAELGKPLDLRQTERES